MEKGADGQLGYSKCKINIPSGLPEDNFWTKINFWSKDQICPENMTVHQGCQLGWKFDQSEFIRTAVSDNLWICDEVCN